MRVASSTRKNATATAKTFASDIVCRLCGGVRSTPHACRYGSVADHQTRVRTLIVRRADDYRARIFTSNLRDRRQQATPASHINHSLIANGDSRSFARHPRDRPNVALMPMSRYLVGRVLHEHPEQPVPVAFPLSLAAVQHLPPP